MNVRIPESLAPLRNLRDIEELERIPLAERIWSWDVNDWIRRGCAFDPDKIALHYVEDGDPDGECVSVSYRELQHRSNQAANLFHSLGVGPGDAVLYLLPTTPQHYAVMLGALAAGIACCVNWMLKPAQLIELIRSSRARVVVALGPTPGFEIWENIEALRDDIPGSVRVLSVQGTAGTKLPESDFGDLAAKQPGDRLAFARKAAPEDVAAYVHSGGTTGSPKLVKLTHRGFCYKCWANSVVMGHTPEDVIFADYPMFHIAGFFGRGVMAIAGAMTIVIPTPLGARDKRFMSNYWKFIEKFRISFLSGVPTTLSVLAKNPPSGEGLASLRSFMNTGSTSLPVEVAREIERSTGVRVLLTYGATEYTQNVAQGPRDGDPKYGSAGLRLPYARFKTVKLGADGSIERDCAVDEIGAVLVSGPSVTPGYVDTVYNEGLFTRDGWFISGDLGRIDADGYLWLTGRAKDVIIRGGHNIDPSIIEEALRAHREVVLVAAVSKPNAHAGELPVAYVQLVDGGTATAEQLAAFAREHITEQAASPKEVYVLEAMPLTDAGKPHKVQLRYDAARRAFAAVLAGALGPELRTGVEVGPDATSGTRVTITVSAPTTASRGAIESQIHEVMKAYATHYVVKWV
jgi:fatty-acyl-CoA synthase